MTEITNEELENLYLSDLSTIIQFRDQELITENEFRYVLHLREDHLKKNGIVWHPYPKEKPNKYDQFLVTTDVAYSMDKSSVRLAWYCNTDDFWFVGVGKVVAFAEVPKPFGAE